MSFARPLLVISRCLGFEACRYNGIGLPNDIVNQLLPFVDVLTPCPESDIGMPTPREPIRVVVEKGERILYQPETGKEFTKIMNAYLKRILPSLNQADGFLLKSRSPSCGLWDVKQYPARDNNNVNGKTAGFFGLAVKEHFPHHAVEDEGRLTNFTLRERYFTQIFQSAAFRAMAARRSMKDLVDFHSQTKLLVMATNQSAQKQLGRLVANPDKRPVEQVLADYGPLFQKALSKGATRGRVVNVLMHALGYFKTVLSAKEKAHFLDLMEDYREQRIPLSAVTSVVKSWIERTDEEYLRQQVFFQPYPPELAAISDSGKGRDY